MSKSISERCFISEALGFEIIFSSNRKHGGRNQNNFFSNLEMVLVKLRTATLNQNTNFSDKVHFLKSADRSQIDSVSLTMRAKGLL